MKKKGTVFRSLVLLLIALATVTSCCVGAFAANFEGDSESGGGASYGGLTGGFSIPGGSVGVITVGYRFGGIKANGTLADPDGEIHGIDVMLSESRLGTDYIKPEDYYYRSPQYSKYEYFKTAWGYSTTKTTLTTRMPGLEHTKLMYSGEFASAYTYWDTALGFTGDDALPLGSTSDLDEALEVWQRENWRLDTIARKVGYTGGLAGMGAGDVITIEPLYAITIASVNLVVTATEIAYIGGTNYGWDSKGYNKTGLEGGSDDGYWGMIANYTNSHCANLLYTENNRGLGWLGISEDELKIRKKVNGVSSGDYYRFYEIMRTGLGVAICYQKSTEAQYDLSIESIIYKYVALDGAEGEVEIKRGSGTTAEIPYGAVVSVWYKLKNNGNSTLSVDPYWGKNTSARNLLASYRVINNVNYYGSNSTLVPKQERLYYINNFTASTAGATGYYAGAVYEYGYTSAAREANPNNNKMTAYYNVKNEFNVGIKQIRYVYKDSSGLYVEQTVASGSAVVPTFPRRAIVKVYCTFYNNKGTTVYIDGYFNDNGTRFLIKNSTNSAENYELPANTEQEFYIGQRLMNELGTHSLTAEVYKHNLLVATGEADTGDNVQTSDYTVYGDVGIQIAFSDKNNRPVNPAEFWHTQEYKVWLNAYNNTPTAQYVDIYYNGNMVVENYYLTAMNHSASSYSFVVEAPTGNALPETLGTYSVNAAVYFKGKTTADGECDVNGNPKTSNNTATKDFVIKAEVGITDIIYKDENDVVISDPMKIKEGTKVKVYYVCTNAASVDAVVDLLYNGGGEVDEYVLPAGTTGTEVFVTEFIASVDTDHKIKGEVYRVVYNSTSGSAEGEINPYNNVYESSYGVIYHDVEIFDIYYKASTNSPRIGVGETTTVLNYGTKYGVYYYLRNNGTEPVVINIYNGEDPSNEGVVCVTPASYDSAGGILIQPGQQGGILAGILEVADQQIGEKPVIGSVFIKDDEGRVLERTYDNNICSESYVFKHNVSLDEVYLAAAGTDTRFTATNASGRIMVPANAKVDVHYVLTNHSGKPITVNIYNYKLVKMTTGIDKHFDITIPANGTVDVVLSDQINAATAMQSGKNYYWIGYVYRAGYIPETDPYELTFEDNSARVNFTAVETPYLEFINPNAPYREGTDVITSYYLYNPTNKAYNGINRTTTVHFVVKIKGTDDIIYETTQSAVVPSFCSTKDNAQLVYFKWSVPEDYLKDTDKFEVCAELFVSDFPDMSVSSLSNVQSYVLKGNYFTPDTEYEEKEPDGWTMPTKTPVSESSEKYWMIWEYSNGTFTQKKYAFRARLQSSNSLSLIPDDAIKTDYERYPDHWVMKSGYGVQIEALADCGLFSLRGYSTPTNDMWTWSQYSYMIWPEFNYAVDYELPTISTLVKGEDGNWTLPVFTNPDKNKVYGPVHFTPLWFPDGYYTAYACHSDIWTPMGMITVGTSDFIEIEGSAYDDWYIGHG